MAFSQGSRSALAFDVESTYGDTPGTPSMKYLPFKSHTLNLTKQRVQGNDIQADRIPRVDRHGNRNALGDIVVDLRANVYDDFIESVMFSTFSSAGEIKVGTTLKSLVIEDRAEDISQYRLFNGAAVSSMSCRVAPNQMVDTTFSMVGSDMNVSGSEVGTPSAQTAEEPFDAYSGLIKDGGSEIAVVTSLDFQIANSLNPTFVVGSATTPQLEYGQAVVTGTLRAYFEDLALINKFVNETESSLEVQIDDPVSGNAYTFLFPRIKYNGASVPVQDPQSRVIELPFVSLYDDTESTNLKITKG